MPRTTRRLCRRLSADYAADYAADYTQTSARACKCLATLAQSVCSPEKVHISKHQCYRTMWNYISEATAKKPANKSMHEQTKQKYVSDRVCTWIYTRGRRSVMVVKPTRNLTTVFCSPRSPPSPNNVEIKQPLGQNKSSTSTLYLGEGGEGSATQKQKNKTVVKFLVGRRHFSSCLLRLVPWSRACQLCPQTLQVPHAAYRVASRCMESYMSACPHVHSSRMSISSCRVRE